MNMKATSFEQTRRLATLARTVPVLIGLLVLVHTAGCGPVEAGAPPPQVVGGIIRELEDDNGLTSNSLQSNGLAFNGLAFNGLAFNGLAFNGLSTSAFSSWFQENPPQSDLFMKYLVRCAVQSGQSRTYSDGANTYTWFGGLGLAPGWSNGAPVTLEEQQIVTACLAALTNKYGLTVTLSVLGANAQGQLIPYTSAELADFPQREACFFGNLFNGEGFFVGNDQAPLAPGKSSLRACALTSSTACPPLIHIGSCQERCTRDPTGTYYTQCTRGGVTYRPITTRIRTQEIFTCGDGICQSTESCGSGNLADDCGLDCGPCN
jgi:hypothetical protein